MLIDDNLVMLNGASLVGTSGASVASCVAVNLGAFLAPGLQDPIPVCIRGGKITGSAGITVQFQESNAEGSGFSAIGPIWTVAGSSLKEGRPVGPRYVPREVTKPWVKLDIKRTATFSSGWPDTIFAGIVREEDQPYTSAQQIER